MIYSSYSLLIPFASQRPSSSDSTSSFVFGIHGCYHKLLKDSHPVTQSQVLYSVSTADTMCLSKTAIQRPRCKSCVGIQSRCRMCESKSGRSDLYFRTFLAHGVKTWEYSSRELLKFVYHCHCHNLTNTCMLDTSRSVGIRIRRTLFSHAAGSPVPFSQLESTTLTQKTLSNVSSCATEEKP